MDTLNKTVKPKVAFYKIIKLDFLGEGQTESYIKVRRPFYSESEEASKVQNLVKDEKYTEAMVASREYFQKLIIEGKIYAEDGTEILLDKENAFDFLPADAFQKIGAEISGQVFS